MKKLTKISFKVNFYTPDYIGNQPAFQMSYQNGTTFYVNYQTKYFLHEDDKIFEFGFISCDFDKKKFTVKINYSTIQEYNELALAKYYLAEIFFENKKDNFSKLKKIHELLKAQNSLTYKVSTQTYINNTANYFYSQNYVNYVNVLP